MEVVAPEEIPVSFDGIFLPTETPYLLRSGDIAGQDNR